MKSEISFALNNFKAIYDRLITINNEAVFSSVLSEFYIEAVTISILKKTVLKINQKYARLVSTLNVLEKDALDEMENVFLEIKDFVKKENINNAVLLEALVIFQDPSKYQTGPIYNKLIAMNMIMVFLYVVPKGKNCKYAVKPVGMKSEEEYYSTNLKSECLLPKTWAWHEKRLDLYSKNEMLECASLKKIEDFFNCYSTTQNQKLRNNKIKNGQNPKLLHECSKSFSVGHILGIPKSYYDTEFEAPRPFSAQEFKQHAGRVFWAIQKILQPKHKFVFQSSSGIFKYNKEEEITFILNTPSWVVLGLFITGTGPKKNKILESEEVRSKILEIFDKNKDEPDLYEVCRAINKRISKAFGLKEFIIYKNETIRINPLYLD